MTSKRLTPIQSIKAYCKFQCCNGSNKFWKNCDKTDCKLHGYRLGHRPIKVSFKEYCTKKHRDLPLNYTKNNEIQTITPPKENFTSNSLGEYDPKEKEGENYGIQK